MNIVANFTSIRQLYFLITYPTPAQLNQHTHLFTLFNIYDTLTFCLGCVPIPFQCCHLLVLMQPLRGALVRASVSPHCRRYPCQVEMMNFLVPPVMAISVRHAVLTSVQHLTNHTCGRWKKQSKGQDFVLSMSKTKISLKV